MKFEAHEIKTTLPILYIAVWVAEFMIFMNFFCRNDPEKQKADQHQLISLYTLRCVAWRRDALRGAVKRRSGINGY